MTRFTVAAVAGVVLTASVGHDAFGVCGTLVITYCAGSEATSCWCEVGPGGIICWDQQYSYDDTWTYVSGSGRKLYQVSVPCVRSFECTPPTICNYTLPDEGCTETSNGQDFYADAWRRTNENCP